MLLLSVSFNFAKAQQTAEKFVQETQYLLYLPDGYLNDTIKKWPLLIFLHGSGESGIELNKVKVNGPPELIEQGKKFPFIVVSPQAPPNTGWKAEVLKGMLDDLKRKYRVDKDRVYLTGLSMGGFGTWDFLKNFRMSLPPSHPFVVEVTIAKYGNSGICRCGVFMELRMMSFCRLNHKKWSML